MKKELIEDIIVFILVLFIYLAVSFYFDIWACSWVIWLVYLLCQILFSDKE